MKERVQKIIAAAGICSRREAENLIREGEVTINGKKAKLGDQAETGRDHIKVKGKLLQGAEKKVYYLFHKPKGVISMLTEDSEKRTTLLKFTHPIPERVFVVGRLEFNESGLIFLTNDGNFAENLKSVKELVRSYRVKVHELPTAEQLEKLLKPTRVEGKPVRPISAKVVQKLARNAVIELSVKGAMGFDLKEVFRRVGMIVEHVERTGIGHIRLNNLAPGLYKLLKNSAIEALLMNPELGRRVAENVKERVTTSKLVPIKEEFIKSIPAKKIMIGALGLDGEERQEENEEGELEAVKPKVLTLKVRPPKLDARVPRKRVGRSKFEKRGSSSDKRSHSRASKGAPSSSSKSPRSSRPVKSR